MVLHIGHGTGNSFSEALILASTNPHACSELVVFMYWSGKSMNNHMPYCGLVDPRISASDKD